MSTFLEKSKSVKMKHLLFVIFIALFSCSAEPAKDPTPVARNTPRNPASISIDHGPRQGFQYKYSTGTEYNYRYYTIAITNDSIVPLHLKISLSRNNTGALDTLQSRFFL